MRRVERIEHDALVDFARSRFDHDDCLLGPGDDQVEIGEVALRVRRIDDDLAVQISDPHRADGRGERNLRHDQRRRSGVDGQNVGIVFSVRGEHQGDDLRLLAVPVRERGPKRPVDQTGSENLFFRRPPFALEEAARDAAAGVRVLLVINGQGHEVAQDRSFLETGGGQNHRVGEANDACAVGLACNRTGLQRQRTAADLHFLLETH